MSNQSNTPETDAIQRVKKFGLLGDIQADLFAMRNHARSMEVQRDAIRRQRDEIRRQRDEIAALLESALDGSAFDAHPITKEATRARLREILEGGQ
jgi:hypothetical protein